MNDKEMKSISFVLRVILRVHVAVVHVVHSWLLLVLQKLVKRPVGSI